MKTSTKTPKYHLNKRDEFIIENYNFAKPFANFFPGIAGKYGIPMWVFYVNRGQAISCFGTKDKDHAIVEFQPANKAWYLVFQLGFRTFMKVSSKNKRVFYEPFHNGCVNAGFDLSNKMSITSYDLTIEEHNASLGLDTKVEYFTIPQDSYAALVRKVTFKNASKAKKTIQLLDGLPQVVPFGVSNLFLKKLSRTIEAWMEVENLEQGVPFYKLDVDPTDRPQVIHIKEGNFYLGFHYEKDKPRIIKPVVDPLCVFGTVNDFSYPAEFFKEKNFPYPKTQITKNKTPSAFSLLDMELGPEAEETFYSLVGNMRSLAILNSSLKRITSHTYLAQKKEENRKIIEELQSHIDTRSGKKEYDLYVKQTYLDNIMRGGYPVIFQSPGGQHTTTFYLYSRKHGDLERDYNKFQIQPTYFSQGNGNYRDINQNRRCDIWFNPDIKDENIIVFFNLLQADGFNPLVVKGARFILKERDILKDVLNDRALDEALSKLTDFVARPFSPGELIFFIEANKIKLNVSADEFLNIVLPRCVKIQEAEHGEGFWADHWTYNLDLLDTYLGMYPDKLKEIVFDKKVFTFYDNSEIVKPRHLKYILLDGLVKQLHSVTDDAKKKEMIAKRTIQPHALRTQYGAGEIYETTLVNKLVCILVNKLSSLDPFGMGIEMESDKPNWFDALNGLPALFGSSLCETFELKRLIIFIRNALEHTKTEKIALSKEVCCFLNSLDPLIKEWLDSSSSDRDYLYWDKSYSLKEEYREKVKFGFSGEESEVNAKELIRILNDALMKVGQGLQKAFDKKSNTYAPYFINEVVKYEALSNPYVKPTEFRQKPLPLFLEAQMHALRLAEDLAAAKQLYKGVKNSPLYDKELKMYKVTGSLKNMPEEIGRCRAFTPGWLENESIWLHMEYKYLLEILRQGLYEEFYEEFVNVLIPFQDPKRYGRSILENSSFLVSSAFPDKTLHGSGFVTRLSGSTAEFIHMWLVMNLGTNPFFISEKNELHFTFRPILAGWLFDKKGLYEFNFLGSIRVSYFNAKRRNTFGKDGAKVKRLAFHDKDGKKVELFSDTLSSPYAEQIRARQIKHIEAYLATTPPHSN